MAMHVMGAAGLEMRPPKRDRARAFGAGPDDAEVLEPLIGGGGRRVLDVPAELAFDEVAAEVRARVGDLKVTLGEGGSRGPGDPQLRRMSSGVLEPVP